jgi:hypothetical protein
MDDSVNDHFITLEIEEYPKIAHAQAISGLKLNQSLDVAAKIVARKPQLIYDSSPF